MLGLEKEVKTVQFNRMKYWRVPFAQAVVVTVLPEYLCDDEGIISARVRPSRMETKHVEEELKVFCQWMINRRLHSSRPMVNTRSHICHMDIK